MQYEQLDTPPLTTHISRGVLAGVDGAWSSSSTQPVLTVPHGPPPTTTQSYLEGGCCEGRA